MELRRCSQCKESKPRDAFYKHKGFKDGVYVRCRDCHNQATSRYRKRVRAWVAEQKAAMSCVDCGGSWPDYPEVLDFDHTEDNKRTLVSKAASIKRAQEEMDKCDAVCANCHRIRTFSRLKKNLDNRDSRM